MGKKHFKGGESMSKIVKLEWGDAELTEKELSALMEIIKEMKR